MTQERPVLIPHSEQTFVEPSRTGDGIVRSFRVPIEAWEAAQAVAEADGINLSIALNRLMIGYGEGKVDLPELYHFDGTIRPRKFRCSDRTWDKAVAKSDKAGLSMTEVVNRFVSAYANRKVALPHLALIYP